MAKSIFPRTGNTSKVAVIGNFQHDGRWKRNLCAFCSFQIKSMQFIKTIAEEINAPRQFFQPVNDFLDPPFIEFIRHALQLLAKLKMLFQKLYLIRSTKNTMNHDGHNNT